MDTAEIIRRSRPDDLPRLGQLFREAFGEDRPAAVWQWKYFGDRPGVGFVCEAEGRLVAHCGGIPVRMRDGAAVFDAFQSVDFMSTPSYPGGVGGGGVFVRTVRRMFDQCCGPDKTPLVYGFPGERHRLVGERLLGYRPLEPVHEFILNTSGSGEQPEPLSADLLRIFGRGSESGIGVIRDEAYLRWRYLNHPLFKYSVFRVRSGWPVRRETAALVRDSDREFLLMELGGSFQRRGVDALVQTLSRTGKAVKGWFSAGHPVSLTLQNRGFASAAREHWIEYRFFIDRTLQPGDLYYTLGDYDVH